jgi:hypothetical protein
MLTRTAVKLILAGLLLGISTLHAALIDLTPGGFSSGDPLPEPFFRLARQVFLDEATPGGWVSLYGRIPGGSYFFTDLINNPGSSAHIWWDFTGQPEGFWLTMIDVFGREADGTSWEHIYGVSGRDRFVDLQHELVTLNGTATIFSISFYGQNRLPDGGGAVVLFGSGLTALFLSRWMHRKGE